MEQKLFHHNKPFKLESGEVLEHFKLHYRTWGKINEAKDNVIWVCHALTGDDNVTDWWQGVVGKGCVYDPEKHFIICANILGSCYGSTGPRDINPRTQKKYLLDFPAYTFRDATYAFEELRKHLGLDNIHTLIGGSMGGMNCVEWAIIQPEVFENVILLATCAKCSPWAIALNATQRMAIEADPSFKDHEENAGKNGLRAARAIALLSYRNYEAYWNTQSETDIEKIDHYRAESYQEYQGDKLINRFNTQSYYFMTKAMDSHHVGRGRESVEVALSKIKANVLSVGISTDLLFPPSEQKFIADNINNAVYEEIDSFYGHDGFLVETKEMTLIIKEFYQNKGVKFL